MENNITKEIEDYRCAKEELRMRLQMMYTQNMGVITAALTLWTIALTALTLLSEKGLGNEAIMALIYLLFSIPAFLALPLSVKNGDNLTRVAQLAAYIRVFHELKSIVSGGRAFPVYECAFKASGQMQGTAQKKQRTFFGLFNCEFSIIVLVSFFMVGGCLIYNIYNDTPTSSLIIGSVLSVVLIFVLVLVWLNSNGKRKFYNVMIQSEKEFIAIAKKLGTITEDDENKYREIMSQMQENVS